MKKTYESKGFISFSTQVKVGEKLIDINFTGGSNNPKRFGKYITNDKKIQAVLESSKDYKKSYKLISIDNELLEKPKIKLSLEEKYSTLKIEKDELQTKYDTLMKLQKKEVIEDEPTNFIVTDIINGQQAKDYIVEKFKVEPDKLKNKMLIMNAAKKYNLSFPDWK